MNINENDVNDFVDDAQSYVWRVVKIMAIILLGFYLMDKLNLTSGWWFFVILALGTMV